VSGTLSGLKPAYLEKPDTNQEGQVNQRGLRRCANAGGLSAYGRRSGPGCDLSLEGSQGEEERLRVMTYPQTRNAKRCSGC
jgi:hypothetical protein